MVPLKLDNSGEIEIINDHVGLKRDVCHRTIFHNEAVWTIDRLGNFFKIEMNDKHDIMKSDTSLEEDLR